MGRCNNRRTQQRAHELANTPARARFSKGPAQRARRGRKTAVVDKLASRVAPTSSASTAPSTTATVVRSRPRNRFDGVDTSRLDELPLTDASLSMIQGLLTDLGVIRTSHIVDDAEVSDESSDEEPSDNVDLDDSRVSRPASDEYDDDFDDERMAAPVPLAEHDVDWEGVVETNHDPHDMELVSKNPVFGHLTTRLSFSAADAARACRALEDWQGAAAAQEADFWTQLGLALDWLSLHLTEAALREGFRPQQSPIDGRYAPKTVFRAVPHASISVAPKLTQDVTFLQTEQATAFARLGFSYGDVMQALQRRGLRAKENEVPALEDEEMLVQLLEKLESEAVPDKSVAVTEQGDEEVEEEEREQERQVLVAIYEDAFEIVRAGPNGRYCLDLPDSSVDGSNASSRLHVFLRPGYPTSQAPLFLFTHAHFAPPLLRRLNKDIVRQAHENVGIPSIFEVVNFLNENLLSLKEDFEKEVRGREFDAEQVRMRKAAGHVVEETDQDGPLSRRQRAKLKAAERAFDHDEQLQTKEKERLVLQQQRLERVKETDQNLRQWMADRALEQRERQRHDEEIRRLSRAAMSAALNRGENVEAARAASDMAERQYKLDHGLCDEPDEGDQQGAASNDDGNESIATNSGASVSFEESDCEGTESDSDDAKPKATPMTTAFMDRLRRMYNKAAEKKGLIHLSNPEGDEPDEEPDSANERRAPCPVAVPVGDLAVVMEDVIAVQKEQPWLIAKEARVPVASAAGDRRLEAAISIVDGDTKRKKESERLKKQLEARYTSIRKHDKSPRSFAAMLEQRSRLPAFQIKDEIVSTISKNQVTLVCAETGAGKTTQVPQLVLDDLIARNEGSSANIIVTQPRRISAIGVSERIAAERVERVGETCGYSIKLEKKMSSKTRLLLCTTGILLRRLQCDPDLASVSHVFVDEVHERDLNTDFLLIILRELLARRKSLKLVLMSATLQAEAFAKYFSGCAVVSIPGRTHPVEEFRLEDVLQLTGYELHEDSDYALKENAGGSTNRWSRSALRKRYYPKYDSKTIRSLALANEAVINYELLALLLQHIAENNEDGAILVFLPGMMEITKAMDEIRRIELFQSDRVVIYPLHSSLSSAEQAAIFEVPPAGVRKVVLATNIAETSITIEDVVYVVDTGRVKENQRDEVKETPALVECWVSRASAKQRQGRAGRVRPGIAYHMFSSHTYEEVMNDFQLPEMLRVGLEDLALQILTLDLGEPSSFLAKALSPPSSLTMSNSLKLLESLGAVECKWQQRSPDAEARSNVEGDGDCRDLSVVTELTALGFHLASLPVEPRVGKLMIFGALFGCVDPALTIAASMTTSKPMFVSPFEQRDAANEAKQEFLTGDSDHLTMLTAFNEWRSLRQPNGRAAQSFASDKFLSRMTLFQMEELRKHYADLLVDIGFLPKGFRLGRTGTNDADRFGVNKNAENHALLKAVLCAGLYPNVIVAPRPLVTGEAKQPAGEVAFGSHHKGDVYLHPCTVSYAAKKLESRYCCFHEIVKTSKLYVRDCTPVSPIALVLFGGHIQVHHQAQVITVDEWLAFRASAKKAALIKHLRLQMEKTLLQKIVSPEDDVTESKSGKALIDSVSILLGQTVEQQANDGSEIVRPFHLDETSGRERGGRGRGRGRGGRGRGGRGRRS